DQAELHRFVAVFFFRAALHDDTWTRLQHGATNQGAVVLEDLRHAQLDSDNSVDRHRLFSFLSQRVAGCGYWLRTAFFYCAIFLLNCFYFVAALFISLRGRKP